MKIPVSPPVSRTLPAPATVPPMMLPGERSIEIASFVLPVIGTMPVASVPM